MAEDECCYDANLIVWSDYMEHRESVIYDLNHQIENLSRLQPWYRIQQAGNYDRLRNNITQCIRNHRINVRSELAPHVYNLYRRYFD